MTTYPVLAPEKIASESINASVKAWSLPVPDGWGSGLETMPPRPAPPAVVDGAFCGAIVGVLVMSSFDASSLIHNRQPRFNEGPAMWHLEGATLPLLNPLP